MSSALPPTIGRYKVISRLGQGGMGSVYLATDPAIDRMVAIKFLREGLDEPELRERFLREARAVGRLQHSNIVVIFDVGEDDGRPYIAMEYVQGSTLREVISRKDPVSLAQKLSWIEQLCAALAYAHKMGVVHRDIKPSNLVVDPQSNLKILDFGIARLLTSSNTQAGMLIGTMNYMAPEQVLGAPIDHRADMFAVGAVCYELLSGRQAFPGGLQDGILLRVLHETPEPLAAISPDLDPDIIAIVERALQKEPAKRYQDLEEMRVAVSAVREKLGPSAIVVPGDSPAPPQPAPDLPVDDASAGATIVGLAPPVSDEAEVKPDCTVFLGVAARGTGATENADATLVVTGGGRMTGHVFKVTPAGVDIGRGGECEVCIPDPLLSRHHARVGFADGAFTIVDLGSSNGTFVNGRRVRRDASYRLFFNAAIKLGGTVLTFTHARDTTLPDLTGCRIAGRYALEELVRTSPKAAVYRAEDTRLLGKVAIKLLSPALMRYPGYHEQFEREARTVSQMDHPHICRVLDFGDAQVVTSDGSVIQTCYVCFPFMVHGSLAARVESKEGITPAQVGAWIDFVAGALQSAHEKGVVHGDLKPSAIVFDSGGNIYVTDFAIAQSAAGSQERLLLGTPAYMAPEQWNGDAITGATDQYALAVIAFYLLAGSRPFEGQDDPDVRERNFRRGPVPVHEEARLNGREVPRALSAVLRKALSVCPGDRYESIAAFARAFTTSVRRGVSAEPRVFMSYQRDQSAGWAQHFVSRLKEQHGIDAFMDTDRIDSAGPFPARLKRAIEECDVFACLLGTSTLQSGQVRREIEIAYASHKPMIPIFQEAYVAPSFTPGSDPAVETLISYDGVHLFDRRNVHVEHTIGDLARLVKGTLDRHDD